MPIDYEILKGNKKDSVATGRKKFEGLDDFMASRQNTPDLTPEFTPEKVTSNIDKIVNGVTDLIKGAYNTLEPTSANVVATGLEGINQFASDPIGTVNKLTVGSALRLGGMIGDAVTDGAAYSDMDKWLSENTESGVKLFDPNTSILREASEGFRQHSKQYSEKNPIPDSFMGELGAGGTSFGMTVVPAVITALATKNPATVAKVAQSLGYTLETSSQYQDLLDSGYKPEDAMTGAHTYGIMASILEKQVPEKIAGGLTKDFLKKGYKKLFKEMAERGGLEGFTEVTQDVLATSLKWDRMDDKQKDEYLKGLPSQAARTFAVSFILGVAGGLPGDINQVRSEKQQLTKEIKDAEKKDAELQSKMVDVQKQAEQTTEPVPVQRVKQTAQAKYDLLAKRKKEIEDEVTKINKSIKTADIFTKEQLKEQKADLMKQRKDIIKQQANVGKEGLAKLKELDTDTKPVEGLTQEKSPVDLFNQRMKEANIEQQTADLPKLTPTETVEPQSPVKGMEVKQEEIDTFANRIAKGERMDSEEDLQFQLNNAKAIEKKLQEIFKKQQAKPEIQPEKVEIKETGGSEASKTNLLEEAKKYKSADEFIKAQPNQFPNSKIKQTVYHGTHENFTEFRQDFDYENIPDNIGQIRDYEVPYGVVFLSDNPDRVKSYGGKVVPVDINAKKVLKIDAGYESPDIFFDEDYNGENKIWSKFENGGYDVVEITGRTPKHGETKTYITFPGKLKTKTYLTDIWNKANPGSKEAIKVSEAEPVKEGVKEPWEMTRDEYITYMQKRKVDANNKIMEIVKDDPEALSNVKGDIEKLQDREYVANEFVDKTSISGHSRSSVIEWAVDKGKPVPLEVLQEFKGKKWADDAIKNLPPKDIEPTGATGTDTPVSKEGRFFTEDGYKQDRKDVNNILNRPNSFGAQLEAVPQMLRIAGYHLENIVRKGISEGKRFTEWTKAMVNDLGRKISPHLRRIWEETKRQFGKKLLEYSEKNPFMKSMNIVEGSPFVNNNLSHTEKVANVKKPIITNQFVKARLESVKEIKADLNKGAKKYIYTLYDMAGEISQKVRGQLYEFEMKSHLAKEKDFIALKDFFDKTKAMDKRVKEALNIHFLRNHPDSQTMQKFGGTEMYNSVKETLDKVWQRTKEVGLKIPYKKDYFPRVVKDHKGLAEYLYKNGLTEHPTTLAKRLEGLTDLEAERYVDGLLRNRNVLSEKKGNLLLRTIDDITEDMQKFYHPFDAGLALYIDKVNEQIEAKRWLSGTKKEGIDDAIQSYVDKELAKEGDLEKIYLMKDIIKARLNPTSMNKFFRGVKFIAQYTGLSQISTSIKQLGAIGTTMAQYGARNTAKGVVNREFTLKDFGLDNQIMSELQTSALRAKSMNSIFRKSGLSMLDAFDKGTYINAAVADFKKRALKNDKGLSEELTGLYGEQRANKIIDSLKKNDINDDVKLAIFGEIVSAHAVTQSNMPIGYLSGSSPIKQAYTFMSYTINTLNLIRNKSLATYLKGVRTGDSKLKWRGAKNLLKYSFYVALMNDSVNAGIDYLMGEEVEFDVMDSLLNILGVNRYGVEKVWNSKQPYDILGRMSFKDAGFSASLLQTAQGNPEHLIKHVPLFGRIIYHNYFKKKK